MPNTIYLCSSRVKFLISIIVVRKSTIIEGNTKVRVLLIRDRDKWSFEGSLSGILFVIDMLFDGKLHPHGNASPRDNMKEETEIIQIKWAPMGPPKFTSMHKTVLGIHSYRPNI